MPEVPPLAIHRHSRYSRAGSIPPFRQQERTFYIDIARDMKEHCLGGLYSYVAFLQCLLSYPIGGRDGHLGLHSLLQNEGRGDRERGQRRRDWRPADTEQQ